MKIERGRPRSRLTTIGTGGPARAFARPETLAELEEALAVGRPSATCRSSRSGSARTCSPPTTASTRWSLRLAGELAAVEVDGELLVARAAARRTRSASTARATAGLGGFEFACAIPGTAGGGVRMNAGAYGSDWAAILDRALVVDGGRDAAGGRPTSSACRYRHSSSARSGRRARRVPARAAAARRDQGRRRATSQAQRKAAQPTNKRTFGSVFKNPEHELGAGRMLEALRPEGPPDRRRA